MQCNAAFAVAVDDSLAAVDTLVVDNSVAHTDFADTAADIAAAVGSSVVAHSTVVLDIAGTAVVGFVGVYLHPCKHGSLLWTACKSVPLASFQFPALLPQESPGF